MKYCCQIILIFFLLGEVKVSSFVAHSYLGSVAILFYEVLLIKAPVDFLPLVMGDLIRLNLLHIQIVSETVLSQDHVVFPTPY